MRSVLESLGLRLFLLLFGVIVAAFTTYAYFSLETTEEQWHEAVSDLAKRFSDLIQRSTHYAMLQNRKEDVHHTIRAIAGEPGVEGVRIYNKEGRIIFSADDAEIDEQVDLHGEACVSCHAAAIPLETVPEGNRVRVFRRDDGHRVLGLINPIENAPECSNAACHAHDVDRKVLGVLDVTMSMEEPDARLALASRRARIAALLIALVAGLFSAAFIYLLVRRPVHRLIEGAQRVSRGDLDTEIEVRGHHEMGRLAGAFNSMTRQLRSARGELTSWSERLESALRERTEQLERSQREVVHMEKMASLGKLSATVAHELNNPLAGILTYSKLVDRTLRESTCEDLKAEREELERYLQLIQREAARSGEIVRNLLTFARRSGARLAEQRLNPILERALMLLRHHFEMSSIVVDARPLEGDDTLTCDGDQVLQALVALLVNAVEAMPSGGTLQLVAECDAESVSIKIADTGVGIPEGDLTHIFEPFFSSKEGQEASGLGLAVVYGIVRRHEGTIDVSSRVDEGTTFTIRLPRRPPQAAAKDGVNEGRVPA
jgi:two-component system NtrC family sensor kinase